MDEIDRDDEEGEYEDEQIEQMIIDNGILLHSLATLLVLLTTPLFAADNVDTSPLALKTVRAFPNLKPDQTVEFDGPDRTHTLYMWTLKETTKK